MKHMYHVDEISPCLGVPKHGRQVRSLAVRDRGRHGDLRVRVGQALIQVLCYFYLYGHSPYVSVEKNERHLHPYKELYFW